MDFSKLSPDITCKLILPIADYFKLLSHAGLDDPVKGDEPSLPSMELLVEVAGTDDLTFRTDLAHFDAAVEAYFVFHRIRKANENINFALE